MKEPSSDIRAYAGPSHTVFEEEKVTVHQTVAAYFPVSFYSVYKKPFEESPTFDLFKK